jgi:carbon storage regulator CsrA
MLVLSRKESEHIQIGEGIRVTVLKIGNTVKLGIEAPLDIPVRRDNARSAPKTVLPFQALREVATCIP